MSRVVSGTTGRKLLCCWNDCTRLGDTRWRVVVRESRVKNLVYVFCGERHRQFWAHSHVDHLNLPSGSKSGGPVQGVDLAPEEKTTKD